MSKPDYGKFSYNARDWKISPKSKEYDENFDKIFNKKCCIYCFCELPDTSFKDEDYIGICYHCLEKLLKKDSGEKNA